MDELFVLVYFLIALNMFIIMFIIMFMGYKECNNQKIGFEVSNQDNNIITKGMETDNIFTRNR